jgi:glycerol uptake facilitator-like aquaporin
LSRRLVAEGLGTALLLTAIVGSGIMGERLAAGNIAIALLANSIATGAILVCLISALGPISGAHFNPVISLADAMRGGLSWTELPLYVGAQVVGSVAGVVAANVMFGLPAVFFSHHARGGGPQLFAEFLATFGLLLVIWGCARAREPIEPFAISAYIVAAYWFTSSTSFANPAVAIARSLSNTFAGIRPQDVPGFILAEGAGGIAATLLFGWFLANPKMDGVDGVDVVMPHKNRGSRT